MKPAGIGLRLNFLRTSAQHYLDLPRRISPEQVSSVHETRYRQLQAELKEFTDQLSGTKEISPAKTKNQIIQTLTVVNLLLRQHQINKRGQCKFCSRPRWRWMFWSRRPPCTVYRTASFVMRQEPDETWRQLFDSIGKEYNLVQVRRWLHERTLDSTCALCGEHST
jgi:hypothetical protein